MNNIKFGVSGCFGRVGSQIVQVLQERNCPVIGHDKQRKAANFETFESIDKFIEKAEVIIDFSHPEAMKDLLINLAKNPKPLISGTTGHNNCSLLEKISLKVPVLWSANMSLGMNIVLQFIKQYINLLEDFDISIIDMHRKNKIDSPSGTALQLEKAIHEKTSDKNVKIASIRSGDIFGTHSLMFANDDEIIEIKHQALNRKLFATGAIKAAEFLLDKKAGLYSMEDIF